MKKMKFFLAASILFSTLVVSPSLSLAAEPILDDSSISTFKPIIEWRLKIINGYLYKRQYNHSKQQWIGEWIKC